MEENRVLTLVARKLTEPLGEFRIDDVESLLLRHPTETLV
jgi:hypothetical protein